VLADATPKPHPSQAGLSRMAHEREAGSAKENEPDAVRARYQQDLWHYTIAKMVDACAANGLKAFYGPFGDFSDSAACEAQFRNAFLLGCAGAWTLHPSQIGIAKAVFSPDVAEVLFARRILEAMPDGSGAVMIDGKMQDDATWKQAKVIVDLARTVAAGDRDLAAAYGL
jgi:malyl-CoA/(S)-citramalyl-CoA lyase